MKESTVAKLVFHVNNYLEGIEYRYYHLGQISLLRKLIVENPTESRQ
ncbi:MAG: hypothetical protein U0X91_04640 [Spirosomataceae bacterium]